MRPAAEETSARPRIGRYLITGRLGKGGMGMVYRGLDEALEREVAVKTITLQSSTSEESQKRFEVEAKAAARMQHPNIVAVFELAEDRGVRFIAMELLQGTDLDVLLRSAEEILLAEMLDVAIQVCRGLAYAHERGVFHRDIKPANIGLIEDGTAKIMDFGIAKMEGTQLTKTGMMVGTVNYMSPEQVHGKKLDGRTDIFSMGVILYQMLAGERPFRGDSVTQVLYKIVKEPPPPLDLSSYGEVGSRLASIVERALAKDRDERYQGAGDLADALQKVLDEDRKKSRSGVDPGAIEGVAAARRKVRAGQVDDAVAQLRTIVTTSPALVEARRELRTALRLREREEKPEPEPTELATELEATFQAAPTRVAQDTELQPTVVVSDEPAPAPRGRRGIVLALGASSLVLGVVGFLALGGREVVAPAPTEVRVPVRSMPQGATVLVDGTDTGVVTPGELVLSSPLPPQAELTFRKAGHRDEKMTLALPPVPGQAVSVTLPSAVSLTPVRSQPPGAAVALDGERVAGVTPLEVALDPESEHTLRISLGGHVPGEVHVAAGEALEAVDAELRPLPPPGHVSVVSSYPVDVLWRGQALARGAVSPRVELPSGPQVVTLVSSPLLLRADRSVSVPAGGQVAIEAPGVGEINIRALPDNCEILIGGTFVDYPPILGRELAAGQHTVTFRWPDGVTSEQTVPVTAGRSAYVTGRKD